MTSASRARRLRLADHVRACEVQGQVILLDLRANRYVGIRSSTSAELARAVSGWPISSGPCDESSPAARQTAHGKLIEGFIERGLLIAPAVDDAKPIATTSLEEATNSLDLGDIAEIAPISPRRIARFLRGTANAAWWLRWHSLHSIAATLTARRAHVAQNTALELNEMRRLAAAYEYLRPLLFTAYDKCLFDSLALQTFLAGEGLFPRWVIGVRAQPFGAHSWVQSGTTVLNDLHEHVRKFRPILVV